MRPRASCSAPSVPVVTEWIPNGDELVASADSSKSRQLSDFLTRPARSKRRGAPPSSASKSTRRGVALVMAALVVLASAGGVVGGSVDGDEAEAEEEEHQFVGENALLFVFIICTSLFAAYMLKKHHIDSLPESGAAMIFGMCVGALILVFGSEESETVMFKPEVFFFVLLPPIIFEAGYSMKKKAFFSNFSTIMFFAVAGTVVSTLVIGYGLYFLAVYDIVPLSKDGPLECLIFGALISAVDPVATLSILGSKRVNADPMLYNLVFGESVLNDAVAIVLYKTFENFSGRGSFTDVQILEVMGEFIGVSLGSICIGVVVALASAFMHKNTNLELYPSYEFILLFFFSYGSYCIAEILQLSGIMSLFFCGILMAHYTWYNISEVSRTVTKHAFEAFAQISETFLFAYLGITAVVSFRPQFNLKWDFALIFFTLLLCVLSRALNIFPFSMLANIRRKRKISFKAMLLMWFSGLRGAIAFALSLNVPTTNRSYIVPTTMIVVIFTTLGCGSLTETVINKLGLKAPRATSGRYHASHSADHSANEALIANSDHPDSGGGLTTSSNADDHALRVPKRRKIGGIHYLWKNFDNKYMKRYFGGRRDASHTLQHSSELVYLNDEESDDERTERQLQVQVDQRLELSFGQPLGDSSISSSSNNNNNNTSSSGSSGSSINPSNGTHARLSASARQNSGGI